MPRRRGVPKRKILPDAVYDSDLASRFINKMMVRGKKNVSEKIFYQAPIEVSTRRRVSLGIRWIVNYARERGEKVMAERLANEVMEAAANRGASVKKREDVRRMADANKAFAHYRW